MSACSVRFPRQLHRPHVLSLLMVVAPALLLSGCATWQRLTQHTPPQPPPPHPAVATAPPQPAPPAPTPKPRRYVREVPREVPHDPEKVASLDPKNLIGLQPAAVERLLGTPSNVSSADPSLVWTYAGQGCSFQVYFYPDLKTATFHALKYSSSGNEQADPCIRSILTVKNNGPS